MQLIRYNCYCAACYSAAHAELGAEAGQVTGNVTLRQLLTTGWGCVYCGGPVTGGEGYLRAAWHTLQSALEGVAFEHQLGHVSRYPWVRWWAAKRSS